MPGPLFSRAPRPDLVYDASDAWIVDVIAGAVSLVRSAVDEAEDAATALNALERQVSWEGPAARDFRARADALSAAGSVRAAALADDLDDLRALRSHAWILTQDGGHG